MAISEDNISFAFAFLVAFTRNYRSCPGMVGGKPTHFPSWDSNEDVFAYITNVQTVELLISL